MVKPAPTSGPRPDRSTLRRAFTLIELLIVLVIILLLSGLLLAGFGLLRETTEVVVSRKRIQDVNAGLLQATSTDRPLADRILALADRELRWAPVRAVLSRLIEEHGYDEQDPAHFALLPPRLRNLHDRRIGVWKDARRATWLTMVDDEFEGLKKHEPSIDRIFVWRNLRDFTDDAPFDAYQNSVPYEIQTTAYGNDKTRSFFWIHRDDPPFDAGGGGTRWAWLLSPRSMLGENLDATLEILPDALRPASWYRERWPVLSETLDGATVVQRAWPDSDWDQADPGDLLPLWEAPFGRPIIRRTTGELVGDHLIREAGGRQRQLGDFCPIHANALLRLAGVLAIGQEEDYRQDRGRDKDWNDRWGNPLIAACGVYVAPRYDLDPADPALASHGHDKEYDSDLQGGRDWFRRRSQEIHHFNRSAHVVTGALGPQRGVFGVDNPIDSVLPDWQTAEPLRWTESDERQVLRAVWLQIREICGLERWRDAASSDAPWTEPVKGKRGRYLSLCSAPVEVP